MPLRAIAEYETGKPPTARQQEPRRGPLALEGRQALYREDRGRNLLIRPC